LLMAFVGTQSLVYGVAVIPTVECAPRRAVLLCARAQRAQGQQTCMALTARACLLMAFVGTQSLVCGVEVTAILACVPPRAPLRHLHVQEAQEQRHLVFHHCRHRRRPIRRTHHSALETCY